MARPELGDTDFGRGIKNPKNQAPAAPKAKPTPAPSLLQRLKHVGGEMTYLPARQAGDYLTDAVKNKK